MKKNIFILVVGTMLLSGCNDYLDKVPDNRTVIDSPEAVAELLVSAYPDLNSVQFCELMTDNVADKGVAIQTIGKLAEEAYKWKDPTETSQDTPIGYWTSCYGAIAACNHALQAIEELGDGPDYQAQKGEAFVARAYCHFMLVNLFSQHYDPATASTDLGVPYVTEPEDVVFKNYERLSVAKVYELIEKDLEKGLPLIKDKLYGSSPKWHFNKAAANTFASRFYLYYGKFKEAAAYATLALGTDPALKVRSWVEFSAMPIKTREQLYASPNESNVLLVNSTISYLYYQPFFRYGLTSSLSSDIFRSRVSPSNAVSGSWAYLTEKYQTDKGDAVTLMKFKYYFKGDGINAEIGLYYSMINVFTGDEALLNRIEANTMLGNYNEALSDIAVFYSKNLKGYNAAKPATLADIKKFYSNTQLFQPLKPFYPMDDDQAALVQAAVDFRRGAFLMEGMRWFDIKRFGIVVTHTPYGEPDLKDVLKVRDLRRAIQIPGDAIAYGIPANPR